MAASSGEEKTRTGSRGDTERKALRMEGGDILVLAAECRRRQGWVG